MNKKIILFCLVTLLLLTFTGCTKGAVAWYNNWQYGLQKTDDATNYKTIKQVEDTCRAMISSYETDKLTYIQYKDSENKDEKSWSSQAKMRANKTVNTYNNYILKNSFVWTDNIPSDIYKKLEIIE